ncbi:MAG: urate hydroxylase PuuD [Tahibacter sp.]
MSEFLIECAALALRWLHVVAAIAWIGESFYFVMLDRALKPAANAPTGVFGELWSVHGGGFYHKQKYLVAPAQMPQDLHWSKWKSYTTWMSGFALFALLYLWSPDLYLIDPGVAALSSTQAVALALAFPLLGWLIYDLICRAVGFRDGLLGALVLVQVIALSYAATHVFAGRAAFLLVGAVMATIMSANVFFIIIPGQKRMVAALARGESPDPLPGKRAKQRSVHNTYFTLPVVFAMLSNHYATAYVHPRSWLVLLLFMAAGALIRQFFVLWHSGGRAWGLLAGGCAVLLGVFAWLAPQAVPAPTVAAGTAAVRTAATSDPAGTSATARISTAVPDSTAIHKILLQRCTVCHSAHPSMMAAAPKGAMFDDVAVVEKNAALIHRQVVTLRIMPPGNVTQISDEERAAIARWFEARTTPAR